MTDAQQALAQVREALAAMRGDWLGDGFTKLRRSQIVAVLDEQAAEIERLTEENRRLRADLLAGRNVVNAGLTIHTLTAERDDLRRQLAEAEMDAERYRWLRANREFCVAAYPEGEWVIPAGMVFLGYSNPDADSWIDAARSLESSNE